MNTDAGRLKHAARHLSGQFGRSIAGRTMAAALFIFGVSGVALLLRAAFPIFSLDESGYGDSYILYDVLQFQKTGAIYRDLTQPPYVPAQYSPLLYILLSIPGRLIGGDNPFVGPRLFILGSFLGCIGVTVSLVRTLVPVRWAWIWTVVLVGSISSMWPWVLQLRADFPGILFNLLAVRLLLSRSRWAVPLAALSVAMALQFKFTFVAGGVAGTVWLVAQRRWKDMMIFVAIAGVAAATPYLLYSLREPRMFAQLFALSPGIAEVKGNVKFLLQTMTEPVVLLALIGLPPIILGLWPRWLLVVTFVAASVGMAALFDLQAGGNINYYFEALFATTVIAVFGTLRLVALSRRNAPLGLFAVTVLAIYMVAPRALSAYRSTELDWSESSQSTIVDKMDTALRGRHVMTTVPRLALMDSTPALTEPYLLSYLLRIGKFDLRPLAGRIRSCEYEAVITPARAQSWRGIPHIAPELHDAIAGSYQPQCTVGDWLVHLPTACDSAASTVPDRLATLGCAPIASGKPPAW